MNAYVGQKTFCIVKQLIKHNTTRIINMDAQHYCPKSSISQWQHHLDSKRALYDFAAHVKGLKNDYSELRIYALILNGRNV